MMMMKRSPSSSSSSSSSSCVVDHFDALNQPIDEEKPRPKRVRRRNSSSKAIKSETNANGSENSNRRSSIYRGVTRHRWTGRFEAHLWDKSSWNTKQNKKGRQVYLGAYDSEADAARTYDLAALKYWGPDTTLNFPIQNYKKEIEEMQNVSKEEYLASLRRQSSGFSRGVSKYRGVARHHHNGRWEARIGRVFGNKYLYLGTFSSQEEAAAAYDLAAIEYRGPNAVTNFDISNYIGRVKSFIPTQPKPTPTSPEAPQHGCLTEHDPLPPLPPQGTESGPFDEPHLINDDPPMLAVAEEETDHDPWSFCLDSGAGYGQFMVPEVPFMVEEDGRFFDLIDQTGFEDDIDLIFDGEMNVHVGDHGVVNGGCGVVGAEEEAVIEVAEEEGQLLSSSSPVSSSSSTTTLVSVACQL